MIAAVGVGAIQPAAASTVCGIDGTADCNIYAFGSVIGTVSLSASSGHIGDIVRVTVVDSGPAPHWVRTENGPAASGVSLVSIQGFGEMVGYGPQTGGTTVATTTAAIDGTTGVRWTSLHTTEAGDLVDGQYTGPPPTEDFETGSSFYVDYKVTGVNFGPHLFQGDVEGNAGFVGYGYFVEPRFVVEPGPAPIAALSVSPTGNPGEFRFDASSSVAQPGTTITKYAIVWGDEFGLSSGPNPIRLHTYDTEGTFTATLTVTASDGQRGTTSVTIAPSLSITGIRKDPDPPVVGQPLTLAVDVQNEGATTITGVTVSTTFTPATVAELSGPDEPATFDLAPGTLTTVHVPIAVLASAPGAEAHVGATGTSGADHLAAVTRDVPLELTADVSVVVHAPDPPELPGKSATVKATITNDGGNDFVDITAHLDADLATGEQGTAIVDPADVHVTTIAAGASKDVSWSVTFPDTAKRKLTATVTGKIDGEDQNVKGSATYQPADGRLIVTTTGDEALPDDARDRDVCDVDPDADGNQCTLRAAIQLANAQGGTRAIDFDIPHDGDGPPVIAPVSELPEITTRTNIDGSSQPGGWVEVDGGTTAENGISQLGYGLRIAGAGSSVRGLAVHGFGINEINITASDVHIAGNRIGTNAEGTAAAPIVANQGIGVDEAATGAVIGGTDGTAPDHCAGDCNVLTGRPRDPASAKFLEWMGTGGGFSGAGVISEASNTTVIGNYVGVDVTGARSLHTEYGIAVLADGASVIGGPATQPGRAPGNVVGGFRNAGIVDFGEGASVQGNLVGFDDTGTHSLNTDNPVGIVVAGSVTVGGDDPAEANVVGGAGASLDDCNHDLRFASGDCGIGIFAYSDGNAAVVGNTVGIGLDGRPSSLDRGIEWFPWSSRIHRAIDPPPDPFKYIIGTPHSRGNVVGNAVIGVDMLGPGVLGPGDRIGIDRDGRVVANTVGVDLDGPNDHSAIAGTPGLCGVGCQRPVVSGNRIGIVAQSGHVGRVLVGTDASGTTPVPNGTGISVRGRNYTESHGVTIGGDGGCAGLCTVVAGNSGPGVDIEAPVSVPEFQYTELAPSLHITQAAIGTTGGGDALPNGGSGIHAQAVSVQPGSTVDTSFISYNGGFGAELDGLPSTQATLAFTGNHFTGNAEGAISSRFAVPAVRRVTPGDGSGAAVAAVSVPGQLELTLGNWRLEVFANRGSACQAEVPLKIVDLGTLAGSLGVHPDVDVSLPAGYDAVSVTYLDPAGRTSSESPCRMLTGLTTVTQDTPAGANEVPVTSNDGWQNGDYADIGGHDVRRFNRPGSLIFDAPLSQPVAAGTVITEIDPPGGDTAGPAVSVTFPVSGQPIAIGSVASATATCTDAGVGVEHCAGETLDTATPGSHSVTVEAWDHNGNRTAVEVAYVVVTDAASVDAFHALARTGIDVTWSVRMAALFFLLGAGCLVLARRPS